MMPGLSSSAPPAVLSSRSLRPAIPSAPPTATTCDLCHARFSDVARHTLAATFPSRSAAPPAARRDAR